jgi:hypothetical protein
MTARRRVPGFYAVSPRGITRKFTTADEARRVRDLARTLAPLAGIHPADYLVVEAATQREARRAYEDRVAGGEPLGGVED